MSDTISGAPYWRLRFDARGGVTADGGLAAELAGSGVSDLFVFSHGWNTAEASAENLYQRLFPLIGAAAADALPAGSVPGFAGIFWPSIAFPSTVPSGAAPDPVMVAAAVPSGAAVADALKPSYPDAEHPVLDRLGELADTQPRDPAALVEFQNLLGKLATSTSGMAAEDAGEELVLNGRPGAVFGTLSSISGSAGGDTQGIADPFKSLWHGAIEAWRTTSFYEMKGRAGDVGRHGLGPLVSRVAGASGVRVHLGGHSFGSRLVAFALAGLAAGPSPVKSLTLVQGAFSHYSFTDPLPWTGRGALAGMQSRVDGPLLATFSSHDRALGWWYPMASLLAHQDSQSVVDLAKRWLAMGADGYQVPGTTGVPLAGHGHAYRFAKGRFYSLDSNAVIAAKQDPISGAHSDIVHPEVAWAIVSGAIPIP